jgi:periplasmic protein TonB
MTSDDMPRFTIAVGVAGDALGAVSASRTSRSDDRSTAPTGDPVVDGRARLVHGVVPSYPDAARADGVEGDVVTELIVDAVGAVASARVVRGVGHGLDEAALRAAHQFQFAPATRDGRPVRVRMGWSMQFRLQ